LNPESSRRQIYQRVAWLTGNSFALRVLALPVLLALVLN
jgi:hypothetical protein